MEKAKSLDLTQSNFAFLFLTGSMLAAGLGAGWLVFLGPEFLTQNAVEISLVLELFAYVPLVVYMFHCNVDAISALRIKGVSLKNVALTALTALAGYIVVVFASVLWSMLLQATGANLQLPDALKNFFEKPAWFVLFALCVYAPLFEEFVFRGMILSGYAAHTGPVKAALITGLMFGMVHGYLPNVVPTALVGVLIALAVIYTGSIFTGVIFHALHNLLAYTMVIDDYLFDLPWKLGLLPSAETEQGGLAKLVWAAGWAIVAAVALLYLLRALKNGYRPPERLPAPAGSRHRLLFWFGMAAACVYIALSSFFMYMRVPGLYR